VHKRFGQEITLNYYPNEIAKECSLTKEMVVEGGYLTDWRCLSGFHYRSHRVGPSREIYRLRRGSELCGVIVYCYPSLSCSGRRLVLPKVSLKGLNIALSTIGRIVIHPKYRSIGLGTKLIRKTLPRIGTPNVEMIAVMAKYNPFAEKAGMKKVLEQKPSKTVLQVADVLTSLGFDLKLLGSQKHVAETLDRLSSEQLGELKNAFIKHSHPRFRKEISATCLMALQRRILKALRTQIWQEYLSSLRLLECCFKQKLICSGVSSVRLSVHDIPPVVEPSNLFSRLFLIDIQ